jgi:hypothetical protein
MTLVDLSIEKKNDVQYNFDYYRKHFPKSYFVSWYEMPKEFNKLISDKNLFIELGVATGENINNFIKAGWKGKIIGFDLWKRYKKPKNIKGVTFIKGDVRNTFLHYIKNINKIDLLSIDLDSDIEASIYCLTCCKNLIKNSYIYIDEFYGFDNWSKKEAFAFSKWLANTQYSFDLLFYTKSGAAFKLNGSKKPEYLFYTLIDELTKQD